jgi:hypothetical protein
LSLVTNLKSLSKGLASSSWNKPLSSQLLRNLVGVGVWSTVWKTVKRPGFKLATHSPTSWVESPCLNRKDNENSCFCWCVLKWSWLANLWSAKRRWCKL